jgi:protein TonB
MSSITASPPFATGTRAASAAPRLQFTRNTSIAFTVLASHAALLWAVQSGLLQQVVQVIEPAVIMVELNAGAEAPAKPAPPLPPKQVQKAAVAPVKPAQAATQTIAPSAPSAPPAAAPTNAPAPLAVADSGQAASATVSNASGAPGASTSAAASSAKSTGTAGPAAPAAPKVELPSSDADYLNNLKPAYPPMSRRLGEQGKVVVRVLIGADGVPQTPEIKQSSGFDRLDQAALNTALRWRYVPGKRNGVAEAMWFNVPINFVLE